MANPTATRANDVAPTWTFDGVEITLTGARFRAEVSEGYELVADSMIELQEKIANALRHKRRMMQARAEVPVVLVQGDRVTKVRYRSISARNGDLLTFEGHRGKTKGAVSVGHDCVAVLAPKSAEAARAEKLAAKVVKLQGRLDETRREIRELCADHALPIGGRGYYGDSFGHEAVAQRHDDVLAQLADMGLYGAEGDR